MNAKPLMLVIICCKALWAAFLLWKVLYKQSWYWNPFPDWLFTHWGFSSINCPFKVWLLHLKSIQVRTWTRPLQNLSFISFELFRGGLIYFTDCALHLFFFPCVLYIMFCWKKLEKDPILSKLCKYHLLFNQLKNIYSNRVLLFFHSVHEEKKEERFLRVLFSMIKSYSHFTQACQTMYIIPWF